MTRIVSIEDDPDVQHLIGGALFKEKYDIHYAWNGQEGYEKILALRPALVLLDLMLPILNGVDVLKKLKENRATRNIPVIIVTSYGDEADMLKYAVQVLGAERYLRKPFVPAELVAAIKQVLIQLPRAGPSAPADKEIKKGRLRADKNSLTVWIDDRLVAALPDKEFALLECLVKSSGQATKAALLSAMGYAASQNDALKQAVCRLRKALGPSETRRIKTTKSGYELVG
ncbi:MAG TPA: response regulator transcription factor [Elusimicrobiota bacterium]|nr:response regulator transcription factor [Elusimicrobiota bacterium]